MNDDVNTVLSDRGRYRCTEVPLSWLLPSALETLETLATTVALVPVIITTLYLEPPLAWGDNKVREDDIHATPESKCQTSDPMQCNDMKH